MVLARVGRGVFGLFLVVSALLMGLPVAHATTGVNQEINYQGRLLTTAGATVPDGTYNVEFKIYSGGTGCVGGGTSPCSGTALWTENWLNHASQGVTVTNGYFSVMLGGGSDSVALSTLNFNQTPLWLSINIGDTSSGTTFSSCTPDGEMLPFTQFASAPYALNAGEVGGIQGSNVAQLSPASTQTFTGANVLQPTTDITPLTVKQTSASTTASDIFDVQTQNGSEILQATGPSSNNSVVTLASIGTGNALTLNGAGALTLTAHAASTWDIGANTLSLQTTNNGAITTGTGTLTDGGQLVVQGTGNALTLSSSPSASATQSLLDLGTAIASGNTSGTFIGVNTAGAYSGDLVNLEVNGTSEFEVDASGDVRQGNGVSIYNIGSATLTNFGNAGGVLSATDMLINRLATSNESGTMTVTTTTAANIVAAIPKVAVGDVFTWLFANNGGNNLTFTGGTGVTVTGAVQTLAKSSNNYVTCRVTNITSGSQAVTCY
jgi:hypothetical protein